MPQFVGLGWGVCRIHFRFANWLCDRVCPKGVLVGMDSLHPVWFLLLCHPALLHPNSDSPWIWVAVLQHSQFQLYYVHLSHMSTSPELSSSSETPASTRHRDPSSGVWASSPWGFWAVMAASWHRYRCATFGFSSYSLWSSSPSACLILLC